MSDIVVNAPLDEGVTINVNANEDLVVNVVDELPVIINMCDNNGSAITDYSILTGKPKINRVELVGDKSLDELGIEPKRGPDDNYVTDDEKSKLDRLLVSFTVPSDTPSLSFDRDKNGVLFSVLGIKSVRIIANFTTVSVSYPVFVINDITSGYVNSLNFQSACFAGGGNILSVNYIDIDVVNNLMYYITRRVAAQQLNPTIVNPGLNYYMGSNVNVIANLNKITFGSAIFAVGTSIKIYRND